ncbi:hypothetical protein cypCar_00005403 [Cyprinus carpio]|nr:hypothetical protein cypCar_00005403 [Cyprinus carpio]
MATELCIILIGYFTFVPAIQEFCLFAVVGLVSDFFLQMFFFTTVLSIDIRRMEVGTVIWIGILVYTDPAGLRTFLAAQVSEQSPLGEAGLPPHLGVAPVFPGGDPTSTLSVLPAPEPTPLPENQSQGHRAARPGVAPVSSPQITWGSEDEELWRRLSFRHWPSLFSYYNITLAKRYISILPVIPVTLHLSPQEAIDTRHPQDTHHAPPPSIKTSDLQTDLTLYKSDIECLASDGMLLASCCLAGQIRVWDAQTGDCLTVISNNGLRRSSSSGCWDHRDGWDHISACEAESLLGADFREPGGVAMGGPDVDIFPIRRRTTPALPALFGDQPDLTPLIDTNFGSLPPSQTLSSSGFDFGVLVEKAYQEHEPSPTLAFPPSPPASQQRRHSLGDQPVLPPELPPQGNGDWDSSVWAMELRGNLIATGRSSGKLELWDAVEGSLRCSNEDGVSGITALAFLNNRIVAARLNGSLDFFTVEINKPLGLLQYRGPPGRGSLPPSPCYSSEDVISCQLTRSVQCAHQKPITVLKAAAGRVVTGSQDHTVRVRNIYGSINKYANRKIKVGTPQLQK